MIIGWSMLFLAFGCYYRENQLVIAADQNELPKSQNDQSLQSEESRSVSSSQPLPEAPKYCESFTFDLATGKTNELNVTYK